VKRLHIIDWQELWEKLAAYPTVEAAIRAFGQRAICKLRLCDECEHCQTYVCWYCQTRKPWANGGTDDIVCDECWLKINGQFV